MNVVRKLKPHLLGSKYSGISISNADLNWKIMAKVSSITRRLESGLQYASTINRNTGMTRHIINVPPLYSIEYRVYSIGCVV